MFQEQGGQVRVKLFPRLLLHFPESLVPGFGGAVGGSPGHDIECVGQGDDPGEQGDVLPLEAGGVSRTVPPFVVGKNFLRRGSHVRGGSGGHLVSRLGVPFHVLPFFVGQGGCF
ncbi:hypothetical protein SDC9_55710 [bioreactor metagenome]|uniref:Uncharacterized protein n=1 Tax=bioreactor metagenome TaxID=1076179 RepID=A0A644X519_9ZZZZ